MPALLYCTYFSGVTRILWVLSIKSSGAPKIFKIKEINFHYFKLKFIKSTIIIIIKSFDSKYGEKNQIEMYKNKIFEIPKIH